jgi:aspartyl protease family protein
MSCMSEQHDDPERQLGRNVRRGMLGILAFWLVVMGVVYFFMDRYLQPKPVTVSASGELVIPRARDGHFYAPGLVNGHPVKFLVDTGASLVSVSEDFARQAGLGPGESAVFTTANGQRPGRIVTGVPVEVGTVSVSAVRVGVGLTGFDSRDALLGQSFLSRFEILLQQDRMVLRPRPRN